MHLHNYLHLTLTSYQSTTAVDFQIVACFQTMELDSCIYVIKILLSLNPHGNEKLERFSQTTYDVQKSGNETLFIAKNNEENNDAWPTNVSQFRQAMR